MAEKKGVAILITGSGKGKTTSALGQAFRALGHGWKVCFLQFVKGRWPTGEKKLAPKFTGRLLFKSLGKGFTWEGSPDEHIQAGREAFRLACQEIMSGKYNLVVLDELTCLIHYEIITEKEVLTMIAGRPAGLHLVITGRNATRALIEACDIVSEIKAVKFPQDTPARQGIEY